MPEIRQQPLFLVATLVLAACGSEPDSSGVTEADPFAELLSGAEERQAYHQLDLTITTPFPAAQVSLFRYMQGELTSLEDWQMNDAAAQVHLAYDAPVSVATSVILMHLRPAGLSASIPHEYVCFAEIDHASTRHSLSVDCGAHSTIAYYLAATRIGRSGQHPFHDIDERYPVWRALEAARDNDLIGFYVSIFATLQDALVHMGAERFDIDRFSIRPVMETIIAQFIDHYQRHGAITAEDLILIADRVTDHALPLERLIRYQTVFDQFAHIADITLSHTGGSLTDRGVHFELPTMEAEVRRFYSRNAAFQMSDFRTHIVQNIRHHTLDGRTTVSWEPIPHMYGYNTYRDGEYIGYSHLPSVTVPSSEVGIITIKAVGYAGEFDGVHHDIGSDTPLAVAGNVRD